MDLSRVVTKEKTISDLQGKEIKFPLTSSLLPGWPLEYPDQYQYQHLSLIVESHLTDAVNAGLDPCKAEKLRESDFASYGCYWWPNAPPAGRQLATALCLWIFYAWDDEADEPNGYLSQDLASSAAVRETTLLFAEQCFGLKDHGIPPLSVPPLIALLGPIARDLRSCCSVDVLQGISDHLGLYTKATENVLSMRTRGVLPDSLEGYMMHRRADSGLGITAALLELTSGGTLPESVHKMREMGVMQRCYTEIIMICNDLVSCKKELAAGSIENYIPISYLDRGLEPQGAVVRALESLQYAKYDFDQTLTSLLRKVEDKPEVYFRVESWANTAKNNCTGNMAWSLETARYGLKDCPRNEHEVTVTL